ncbi:MAG: cysteine desulfurase family protein, partial [Vicinamibacterales bacterium]
MLDVMLPFLARPGNASSVDHVFGRMAREAVEHARVQVAALIGASPKEIVFTSGATEANNLALKGVAGRATGAARHIVTAVTEHPSVLEVCARLEADGMEVTYLPVDAGGRVDPEQVRAAIRSETIVVTVMAANNEIGTLQPIAPIAQLARERGVPFHTDAAQAAGKIPLDTGTDAIDLMSLSAHKMHGPQGAGALYVRSRPLVRLEPLQHGGGQERGLRPGTLNTAAIVGFGAAADIAAREMAAESARLAALRDDLLARLREAVPGITV